MTPEPPPAPRVPPAGAKALPLSRRRLAARWTVVAGLVALSLVGLVVFQYLRLSNGITTSGALNGHHPRSGGSGSRAGTSGSGMNLLVMGLDSRLDENGKPLPPAIYQALHAGDQSSGGENSNVLILLHVPADGRKATGLSIPRDDYVALPGCPDGQCMGKIKQAYGLGFDQASKTFARQGVPVSAASVQRQRDAGRLAAIAAVEQFLGRVHVDHFVEVTLVAFYELARVVQPITVCVNNDTQDLRYSGAAFHQGRQQINAAQALAFVRQRRDNVHPDLQFTDLDRERRQQAFIASLAYQLKQLGTLADPFKLNGIVNVATANFAIDSGLSVPKLASLARKLSGGNVTFYTLPVRRFGRTSRGEDVNIVDLAAIHATVAQLLNSTPGSTPAAAPSKPAQPMPADPVNIINTTGLTGLGRRTALALHARGFTIGAVTTSQGRQATTAITYGAGAQQAAQQLSQQLSNTTLAADPTLPPTTVQLRLGLDFRISSAPPSAVPAPAPTATALPVISGTGTGQNAPPPTALTAVAAGGIPCVK